MKIKTLESRLKKLNPSSKIENNRFYLTNRTGKTYEVKILKNHDSDDIDCFVVISELNGDMFFDNLKSLIFYIYG